MYYASVVHGVERRLRRADASVRSACVSGALVQPSPCNSYSLVCPRAFELPLGQTTSAGRSLHSTIMCASRAGSRCSASIFKIDQVCLLGALIHKKFLPVKKKCIFWGDLTDIPAQKALVVWSVNQSMVLTYL